MDEPNGTRITGPIFTGNLRLPGFMATFPGALLDAGATDEPGARYAGAHNSIYDNHHPLRVREAMDLVNAIPGLTAADIMATAAMLAANAIKGTPKGQRFDVLMGIMSVASGLVMEAEKADAATPQDVAVALARAEPPPA